MTYWDRKLIREQLDRKLEKLRPLSSLTIENGWIKMIREALGKGLTPSGFSVGGNTLILRFDRNESRKSSQEE